MKAIESILLKTEKKAIKLAWEKLPDLIILDIMMPDMDGIEVCRKLGEIPACKRTFIAFLSAKTKAFYKPQAMKPALMNILQNPLNPSLS